MKGNTCGLSGRDLLYVVKKADKFHKMVVRNHLPVVCLEYGIPLPLFVMGEGGDDE